MQGLVLQASSYDHSDAVNWVYMYVEHVIQHGGHSAVEIITGSVLQGFGQGSGSLHGHCMDYVYNMSSSDLGSD